MSHEARRTRTSWKLPVRSRTIHAAFGFCPPFVTTIAIAFLAVFHPCVVRSDDWPAWRGPTGQGTTAERDLPLRFGPTEGVRWKIDLPAPGNSTPIVWKDKVFLTQATDGGKTRSLWCVDRRLGEVSWKRHVDYAEKEPTHDTNPYCSASPVTDGERVIASFGSAGVVAYALDGEELWRRDLGKFHHIWGNAASPVIHEDLCILNCGPGERTFLAALDKATGEDRWRVEIPGGLEGGDSKTWTGSWSTPLIIKEKGEARILMSFPLRLSAYDPRDGAERWAARGLGKLVYTSPLSSDGIAVAMSGFNGPSLAVRTGGEGDITADQRLWGEERPHQRVGSGVIHDGRVYIVNDSGVGQCLDLESGEEIWKERVFSRSSCWSSLVATGDGLLYGAAEDGTYFVLKAAPRFEIVAENRMHEVTRASVAVSNGELFLRTYEHLWCIGRAPQTRPPSPDSGDDEPESGGGSPASRPSPEASGESTRSASDPRGGEAREDARASIRRDVVLRNGLRLTVFQYDSARKQSFFSLLPLGLLSDARDEEQLSHLAEHLIIRSTDPDSLESDGVQLNGETTALAMRLETFASPERWREALGRHARWLSATGWSAVTEEVIAREKARIASEVDHTVRRGFTQKWAEVAWNQVVRYGKKENVAIRDAVERATVEEVRAWLRARRASRPPVEARLVSVGPRSLEEIQSELEHSIGKKLDGSLPEASEETPPRRAELALTGDRRASWDLDARHYIEWYEVPGATPEDRVLATLLARLLQIRLATDAALATAHRTAFASADLTADGRRFVSLSCALPEHADVETIQNAFRRAIETAATQSREVPTVGSLIGGVRNELEPLSKLALFRARFAGGAAADLLEAQHTLGIIYREISTGLTAEEIGRELGSIDPRRLEATIAEHFGRTRRGSLLLEPAASAEE